MVRQKRPPPAPDLSRDPSVEIHEDGWLGAVATGLLYFALVALSIIIAIHL